MGEEITREKVRHELAVRRITVVKTHDPIPGIRRVTFTGPDLRDFIALGPADHVKVFFPDPETGILSVPEPGKFKTPAPAGEKRIARDYTPHAFRDDATSPELDIEFVLHGDSGVASAWAMHATAGQELAIAGPRGSALLPTGIAALTIIADETAFPATQRWIAAIDPAVPVTALLVARNPSDIAEYFATAPNNVTVHPFGNDPESCEALETALRAHTFTASHYIFLAGEARTLVPLRRYLRRELELGKNQVEAHGYWKRGVINLDHHAPLDPTDPDE